MAHESSTDPKRSPIRFLTCAVIFTALALPAMGWFVFDWQQTTRVEQRRNLKIAELGGIIVHLDEVLTMSARMAATTGDLEWEARYLNYEPQLEGAISEAMRLVLSTAKAGAAAKTDAANSELVRMEATAFDLVRSGDLVQAREILFGDHYRTQKQIYAEGMTQFDRVLKDAILAAENTASEKLRLHLGAILLITAILVIGWLIVLRTMFGWKSDLAMQTRGMRARIKILSYSVATMTLIVIATVTVTIYFLYTAAIEQQKRSLIATVTAHTELIDAVARFDRENSQDAHEEGAAAATIGQVADAHSRSAGLGVTGEFLLARNENGTIHFLLDARHEAPEGWDSIPMVGSSLAEPMRRALSGQSGAIIGLDYRGAKVLAAYEPVPELGLGLIVKQDIDEIRRPFVHAALIAGGIGVLCVLGGATLIVWLNGPLIRRVEDRERELDAIFTSVTDAIITIDHRGVVRSLNPSAESMFGYGAHDIIGRNVSMLMPQPDQSQHDGYISRYLKTGEAKILGPEGREVLGLRRNGSTFQMHVAVNEMKVKGEMMFVGIIRDITEKKRAEQKLRQLSRAIESSSSSVVITDVNGRIEYVNPKFTDVTGYTADEALGQNPRILQSGDQPQEFYRDLWETISSGQEWHGEFRNTKKNGELYWESASISPIRDEKQQITHFVAMKDDITNQKEVQDELRKAREQADKANEAKSAFLANMSHEIRTPMNGILGMTELALDTDLTPEQRDFITTVHSSGEALLTLLNDILDFSKIEAGRLEIDPIDFQLRDAISDTLDTLAARAHGKGLELTYDIPSDVPDALIGDIHRLRQIIVNLVGNAIKFTDKGEIGVNIKVAGRDDDNVTLHIAVRDTGIGIPADRLDAVLRPFEQADVSTTRKYGGTGLGLAISIQLAELMGGRLWVESVHREGSVFQFTVQAKLSDQPTQQRRAEPAALNGLPVLVVDDNNTNRRILKAMLAQWGMQPLAVESAAEALEAVERARKNKTPFRLILSDVNMPEMDGFELFQRLKQSEDDAGIPVVLLTSASRSGDLARAREMGIAAHLSKPVRQSMLLDTICTVIDDGTTDGTTSTRRITPKTDRAKLDTDKVLHILLAEDNAVNQKFATRVIAKAGHDVVVANNGREAVEACARQQFDIVLMDIQMPEMDGLEATAAIRNGDPKVRNIPIVAMTANAMKGDRQMCLDAGMNGYVSKPVKQETLFAEINRVLSGKDGTASS